MNKINKNKIAGLLAALLAGSGLLTGCGSADTGDYSKYVTLGDYRSIKVALQVEQVTDEELEEAVQDALSEDQELNDKQGTVEEGDYVTMGLLAMDGKEVIYDLTDEDGYEMTLDPEEFGQEFVDELVGANKGEELKFTVSYNADFEDGMLAGKDVDYEVDIRDIETISYPELTDAYVKDNFEAASVEEWKDSLRDDLLQEHENEAIEEMRSELLNRAIADATINGYPRELYKKQKKMVDEEFQSYAEMFGCPIEEIYEMLGIEKADLPQQYLDATNRAMVLAEIARKEQLELTDEELQQRIEEYALENEYDSVDELMEDYDIESLKEYLLNEKVLDFLEENAEIIQ